MQIHKLNEDKEEKKKKNKTASTSLNHRLSITLCHSCENGNRIKVSNVRDDDFIVMNINKRMVEN